MGVSGVSSALRAAQSAYLSKATQEGVAVQMLKKSLDQEKQAAQELLKGLDTKGKILDVRA